MQRREARQHRVAEPVPAREERELQREQLSRAPQVPLDGQPGGDPGEAAARRKGTGQPCVRCGDREERRESAARETAQHTGELLH